jgi:chemotaxis protein MotA
MVLCLVSILIGIIVLDGDLADFLNIPSILLVLFPTIGALVSTFPISLLSKIPSHFKVITGAEIDPWNYIDKIVDLAQKARKEGLLALENEKVEDTTMQYALRMIVDGRDKSEIRDSLEESLNGIKERHLEAVAIYDKAAAFAPAFGMCATVVSLVNMLMGLDFTDPAAINRLGVNMAAALITTLYGSMFANIVFLPLSGRLKYLHKKEIFCKTMISNGFLAIQSGINPQNIKDYLVEQLSKDATDNAGGETKDGQA